MQLLHPTLLLFYHLPAIIYIYQLLEFIILNGLGPIILQSSIISTFKGSKWELLGRASIRFIVLPTPKNILNSICLAFQIKKSDAPCHSMSPSWRSHSSFNAKDLVVIFIFIIKSIYFSSAVRIHATQFFQYKYLTRSKLLLHHFFDNTPTLVLSPLRMFSIFSQLSRGYRRLSHWSWPCLLVFFLILPQPLESKLGTLHWNHHQ